MGAHRIDVAVVGAGIGGLAATLAFARAGHRVTLIEQDPAPPPPTPGASFLEWDRPGVPQRRLVHGFLPLARKLLLHHLPEVVDQLVAAGAHHVDQLQGVRDRRPEPGDEDLVVLRCRRTVFEWVLRRVAAGHPGIRIITGEPVVGLIGRSADGRGPAAVKGLRVRSGACLDADLVIDAAGRRSRAPAWLAALGAPPPTLEAVPCGWVYFSRFYERPEDGFPPLHRAQLGYANIASAAADGRTFSLTFFVRVEEPGLRRLREAAAFESAVGAIPGFAPWREGARPLGPVNAMGALANELRTFTADGISPTGGYLPIGDSLSHTDPTLGRGMSLALDNAFCAAALPWGREPALDCVAAYHRDVAPGAAASFRDAVETDELTRRVYLGVPGANAEPRALLIRAQALAAEHDQGLYRAWLRNVGLLTEPGVIVSEPWISRARDLLAAAVVQPPVAPDRDQLLAILAEVR